MVAKAFRISSTGQSQSRGPAMDRATFVRPQAVSEKLAADAHQHHPFELWARRRLGNVDHERRVAQISGALFDLTRDLHGLGRRAHWALGAAAWLHDVGRSVDPKTHEQVGAGMILSDLSLRMPADARRWVAYLTLYHRGPVPDLGADEILRGSDDRESLRTALGLLRAADTLDSRSIEETPRLLLMRRDRRIRISCLVREGVDEAEKAFCRPKKYRLLEETVGCSLDVDVQLGEARMVSG
jgi:exopolyphosphatase/pppGpp-phosphohydrolase